jgi:ATP-dependent DNA helicase RecG
MWATGNRQGAIEHLLRVAVDQPGSGAIASQIIEYAAAMDNLDLAKDILTRFEGGGDRTEASQPYLRYAVAMLNRGRDEEARRALGQVPSTSGYGDLVETAILRKRAGDHKEAHRIFERVYPQASDDPKVVQEFAQTKVSLARDAHYRRDNATNKRLNRQAAELLRRAIQLTDDPLRKAWCWFDLARVLNWLREPGADVENAYLQAMSLKPNEERFKAGYEQWRSRGRSGRSPGA